ncbi:helix-turn-helix transcriptional regulator [Microvirga calopogonii]|uniref:helix-turn-helix transcriptional regulator n=1 Tax=Microvirga calopogonii TaxID=2078013 RepID=UPI000E0CE3D3|nr:WYL domain-containing protein [Microvirga calopogonii]
MNDLEHDTPSKERIRWSVETRLEFIEFRLFWEGRINRSDLVRHFGISVPQASTDLARYQELAPGNLVYDRNAKAYFATNTFTPQIFEPSGERYLAQLRLLSAGLTQQAESWLGHIPDYATVQQPSLRQVTIGIVKAIVDAVRMHRSVQIKYQSASAIEPNWRWISPHGLAFDGTRWHARAWCHRHNDFRDFVLTRMLEISESRPSGIDPQEDIEWHREVTLLLAPNPKLDKARRRTVEIDYGMTNGRLEFCTRLSLSQYLEWQLALDVDPDQVDPKRHSLVLLNREEINFERLQARSQAASKGKQNSMPSDFQLS